MVNCNGNRTSLYRSIAILLCFFVISRPAFAEVAFYLDVSPKSGTLEDDFILSVVIENPPHRAVPILSGGDDFQIQLLGPRQSTTIVNGAVNSELAYNYRLLPQKAGMLLSPAAEVEIDGKTYRAEPVQISVEKGAKKPDNNSDSGIIIRQSAEPQKVYVGQQIRHYLELFAAVPIYDYSFSNEPIDGVWNQNAGDAERDTSRIGGRMYNHYRWQNALYPLRSGTIKIPPRNLEAKIQARQPGRRFPFGFSDPFDDPFGSFFGMAELEKRRFQTNEIKVEVLPLPRPTEALETWGSASIVTGDTSIHASYDRSAIQTGESKTVTFVIESAGNINALDKIPLSDTGDYRIYQESAVTNARKSNGVLLISKLIRLSVVPLRPGKVELPEVSLSYFDPQTATYKRAGSGKIEFEAQGADLRETTDTGLPAEGQPAEEEIKSPPAEPIMTYEEPGALSALASRISLATALLVMLTLLSVAILLYFTVKFLRARSNKAREIERIQAAQNPSELAKVTVDMLASKLDIAEHQRSGPEFRALISNRITDKQAAFLANKLLDQLDILRYARERPGDWDLEDMKNELEQVLSRL